MFTVERRFTLFSFSFFCRFNFELAQNSAQNVLFLVECWASRNIKETDFVYTTGNVGGASPKLLTKFQPSGTELTEYSALSGKEKVFIP